ncbi:MAG: prepilin peptidase [Candidatus Falkowbacteria bacterium]|nr:prepilin peptidase [Candidatus Falkowbacteria bacterium]
MSLLFIFIFGLIIGSFLNCLVWRLYKEESLLGRSYCPHCRQLINWYDNVPILSFILLRGRCRHCRKKISWQYPALEFITGLLFVLAFIKNLGGWATFSGFGPLDLMLQINSNHFYLSLIRDYFIIAVMLIVLIYDLRWYLISNLIIVPAALVIFGLNLFLGFSWYSSLLFAIISSSFFLLQFIITKRRGIGEGDIWLGFLLGLIFPQLSLWWLMIVVAYLLGSLVGLILMTSGRKKWSSKLPLGVFLAAATIFVLLYGQVIVSRYLAWLA